MSKISAISRGFGLLLVTFLCSCSAEALKIVQFDPLDADCEATLVVDELSLITKEQSLATWICSVKTFDPESRDNYYTQLLLKLPRMGVDDVGVKYNVIAEMSPDLQQMWLSTLLLELQVSSGQDGMDADIWHTIISKLTDPELQQLKYTTLLLKLQVAGQQGGEFNPKVMHAVIDMLTDQDLQEMWRGTVGNIELIRAANKVLDVQQP
jgi:hypothetical protein